MCADAVLESAPVLSGGENRNAGSCYSITSDWACDIRAVLQCENKQVCLVSQLVSRGSGAGDEIRTRDNYLGKVALYQLSYTRRRRLSCGKRSGNYIGSCRVASPFPKPNSLKFHRRFIMDSRLLSIRKPMKLVHIEKRLERLFARSRSRSGRRPKRVAVRNGARAVRRVKSR